MSRPFYVYGEGAIWHRPGDDCPFGERHPLIERRAFANRRAYLASRFWRAVFRALMRRGAVRAIARGDKRGPVVGLTGYAAERAFPRVPTVRIDMAAEHSIYAEPRASTAAPDTSAPSGSAAVARPADDSAVVGERSGTV